MSTSALSRKENGDVCTTVHEIRSMMDLYDLYDPELVELARAAKARGWWRAYGIEDRGYVDLETEACAVREFQPLHVPGQFQTEVYMRSLFASNPHLSEREVRNATAARLLRQTRLTDGENLLNVHAIIAEAALWRKVGGAETMRAQLHQLIGLCDLPNVGIQVLPAHTGAVNGLDGSFVLLEYVEKDQSDIVWVEHIAGATHSEKPPDVRRAAGAFDALRAVALCGEQTVQLIKRIADSM